MKPEIFNQEVRIHSDRLLLRPVSMEDAEDLLSIYGAESIYRFRPGMPRKTISLVQKLIGRMQKEILEKKAVYLSVCDKTDHDKVVGIVEVFHMDGRIEKAEIGYTINPEKAGQGIATEAIGLITDYLIWQGECNRITAMVHVENRASQKALLKNGFVQEGTERQGEFWQGIGFVDVCRFAKLKSDYC